MLLLIAGGCERARRDSWNVPLLFRGIKKFVPRKALEGAGLMVGFRGGKMIEQSADGVGFAVEEEVEIGGGNSFDVVQNLHSGERRHGDKRASLGSETRYGADEPGIRYTAFSGKSVKPDYAGSESRAEFEEVAAMGQAGEGQSITRKEIAAQNHAKVRTRDMAILEER